MDERKFNQEVSAVFGWHYNTNMMIVPPAFTLPHFVWERIRWVESYVDAGLSFTGAYDAVLALDEPYMKKEFELGGTWMPTTSEFRTWRDDFSCRNIRQMQVAVAMIYGSENGENEHA